MKVLDLQCQHSHCFEGWFGSEDDFQSQLIQGLLECPLCGDVQINKKLSAPRLNLSASRHVEKDQSSKQTATNSIAACAISTAVSAINADGEQGSSQLQSNPQISQPLVGSAEQQAAWLRVARSLIAQTEDVGGQFADEARKMHYGQAKERSIRGQASHEQTLELLDEGIPVLPMALPKALTEPLH